LLESGTCDIYFHCGRMELCMQPLVGLDFNVTSTKISFVVYNFLCATFNMSTSYSLSKFVGTWIKWIFGNKWTMSSMHNHQFKLKRMKVKNHNESFGWTQWMWRNYSESFGQTIYGMLWKNLQGGLMANLASSLRMSIDIQKVSLSTLCICTHLQWQLVPMLILDGQLLFLWIMKCVQLIIT
jgi:hypothetical protein